MRTFLLTTALLVTGLCAAQLNVTTAEYFWDTDPGQGNGTALTAQDGAFNSAVEAVLANTSNFPSLGTHVFHARAKDAHNNWGPVFSTVIEVEVMIPADASISVAQAEYFWDTDPGEGNGSPMLAFDGNYDAALEAIGASITSLPSVGTHVLHIRSRDIANNWGPQFSVIVEVDESTVTLPAIHVAAAEYWVDTDPGEGQGTPMLASDGAFNAAYERIQGGDIPVPMDAGIHVLWMRSQDDDGGWGPAFGVVANIDTTIGGLNIADKADGGGMLIHPNPTDASEGAMITLGGIAKSVMVQVCDAAGRKVSEQTFSGVSRMRISMDGLAMGVYPVSVTADGVRRWGRIVVR